MSITKPDKCCGDCIHWDGSRAEKDPHGLGSCDLRRRPGESAKVPRWACCSKFFHKKDLKPHFDKIEEALRFANSAPSLARVAQSMREHMDSALIHRVFLHFLWTLLNTPRDVGGGCDADKIRDAMAPLWEAVQAATVRSADAAFVEVEEIADPTLQQKEITAITRVLELPAGLSVGLDPVLCVRPLKPQPGGWLVVEVGEHDGGWFGGTQHSTAGEAAAEFARRRRARKLGLDFEKEDAHGAD